MAGQVVPGTVHNLTSDDEIARRSHEDPTTFDIGKSLRERGQSGTESVLVEVVSGLAPCICIGHYLLPGTRSVVESKEGGLF